MTEATLDLLRSEGVAARTAVVFGQPGEESVGTRVISSGYEVG